MSYARELTLRPNVPVSMERLLAILPEKPHSALVRYGITTAFMIASCLVQVVLYRYSQFTGLFVLLPGIFAAGILFDRGSALWATFIGIALAVVLLPISEGPEQLLPLGFFAGVGAFTAFFSEGLRKLLRGLRGPSGPKWSYCERLITAPKTT